MTRSTGALVGLDIAPSRGLAAALGFEFLHPPAVPSMPGTSSGHDPLVERWAADLRLLAGRDHLVVSTWGVPADPGELAQMDIADWIATVERPLALWFTVVAALGPRCADDGSMVIVIERPASLDSAGRSATVAVAEGVIALMRSAALGHGGRNVRINAVVTEIATAPAERLGTPPLVESFPGRPEVEVAGAVRFLLGGDSCGVSGTVIRADSGRSAS